jgi:hypothetical protein
MSEKIYLCRSNDDCNNGGLCCLSCPERKDCESRPNGSCMCDWYEGDCNYRAESEVSE